MNRCDDFQHNIYNHVLFPMVNSDGEITSGQSEIGKSDCPIYQHQSKSSLEMYWGIVGLFLALRLFVLLLQFRIARYLMIKREIRSSKRLLLKKSKGHNVCCHGIPLTTVFECTHSFMVTGMLVSFGLIESLLPIHAYIMLCLSVTSFLLVEIFSCLKIINLGIKVIPRKLRGNDDFNPSIYDDKLLLSFFILIITLQVIGITLSIIIGPITNDIIYSQYGVGIHGVAALVGNFILIRQGFRIISHMKSSNEDLKTNAQVVIIDEDGKIAKNKSDEVDTVIHKLKMKSIMLFLAGSPPIVLLILCGFGIVPFYWYNVVIIGVGATISSLCSTIPFIPKGMNILPCFGSNNRCLNRKRERVVPRQVVAVGKPMIDGNVTDVKSERKI